MFINVVVPSTPDVTPAATVQNVTFTIYRGKSPSLTTFSDLNLPAESAPGLQGVWYAPYQVPMDAPLGAYTLVWQIVLNTGEVHQVEQLFYIEDVQALQSEGSSALYVLDGQSVDKTVMNLLKHLRIGLRDNNPDRNYHAVPPRSTKEVRGFSNRVGFIWTDEELMSYLSLALAELNSNNPKVNRVYQLQQMPSYWLAILIDIARVRAIEALATNWEQDGFGYNIAGLSLDLNKAEGFMSLKSSIDGGALQAKKDLATAVRPRGRCVAAPRWNI
jgi:hypothetical protein